MRQFLLVLSAVIGIGLGHTLYFASISRLGLAVAAGVVQLQPITVSIGSMLLFDERLNALQWIGGTIAIVGAVIMLIAQHRLKPVAQAEKTRPQTDAVLCGFCGCDLAGAEAGRPCPECGRIHGPAEHAQARA
jgi:drug/metabolite transporter (DMT)-like permease